MPVEPAARQATCRASRRGLARWSVSRSTQTQRVRIDGTDGLGGRLQKSGQMTTYIGVLRAVNLGAHNKIGMADLRALLTSLDMRGVQTLLQSGNVVFQSEVSTATELERLIESAAAKRLRLTTDVLVRSGKEWKALIGANPFPAEAEQDPSHLLAVVLKDAPARGTAARLQDAISGRELVRVQGRCAYIVYPDGIGRSRLTSALIEKHLGTRGTGRNWNTVLKLQALADSMP